jgi:antitoxin component YwqK of YwqJK toxin-antitoxin module
MDKVKINGLQTQYYPLGRIHETLFKNNKTKMKEYLRGIAVV